MAYWISEFNNYLDDWLTTNYPSDYRLYTFRYNKNNQIRTSIYAKIFDDSTKETMLSKQEQYGFKVHDFIAFYKSNAKGSWKINIKDQKHLGEYYIEPSHVPDFNESYYRIKDLVCNKFVQPYTKNSMIGNLCVTNTQNLCIFLRDISEQDLMFLKLMDSENLIH